MLSVIIPTYNEALTISSAFSSVQDVCTAAGIPYEILFVDDGSTDTSYACIEALAGEHPQVKGISFSRNFGKESAIFAGLEAATGDCCVVMDCDLQHPPATIVEMYHLWQQGYEIVEGKKATRGQESGLHSFCATVFYRLISTLSGFDLYHTSDFKLLDRRAVDALLLLPERAPFFRALSSWIGFKTTCVEFEVQPRSAGTSKWSWWSLIKYAVRNITSFSGAPIQLITLMGWVMLVCSGILAVNSLYQYFTGVAVEGFTTVILLLLFIGSMIMISLGIIGYYIARIHDELKGRPRYIIGKRCGD